MKALLIDGERRGEVYNLGDNWTSPTVCLPIPQDPLFVWPLTDSFQTVSNFEVYALWEFDLCGRRICVGSTKTMPPQEVLFDLLASDLAKEAVDK